MSKQRFSSYDKDDYETIDIHKQKKRNHQQKEQVSDFVIDDYMVQKQRAYEKRANKQKDKNKYNRFERWN